jgi:homoserine kinase
MTATVRVVVPCSISNLGPGFDALGLALSLHLEALSSPAEERDEITREGDAQFLAVTDAEDLFLLALRARWRARGPPGRATRRPRRRCARP